MLNITGDAVEATHKRRDGAGRERNIAAGCGTQKEVQKFVGGRCTLRGRNVGSGTEAGFALTQTQSKH